MASLDVSEDIQWTNTLDKEKRAERWKKCASLNVSSSSFSPVTVFYKNKNKKNSKVHSANMKCREDLKNKSPAAEMAISHSFSKTIGKSHDGHKCNYLWPIGMVIKAYVY